MTASAQPSMSHNLSCSSSMYVSSNLWCHFYQCPWEIGSVWAEIVGQVGTYIKRVKKVLWLCVGLAVKSLSRVTAQNFISSHRTFMQCLLAI